MTTKLKTSGKVAIGLIVVAVIFAAKVFWWDKQEIDISSKETAKEVIKIGVVTWPGYLGGQYMNGGFEPSRESRYFQEYGILVQFKVLDDFLASRKAFENGEVDLLWCTVDALPTEMGSKGTMVSYSPRLIFQADWSRGGDAIVVRSGIETVSDLKDKTVAVAQGTPSHSFLIDLLKTNSMTQSDIKIQYVASAIDAANIFKQQAVDAAVVWSPDDKDCETKVSGAKILASTKTATNIIADGFFAKENYIKENEEKLKKLYEGWMIGNMELNTNEQAREIGSKILADKFQMKPEDARSSMNNVRYVTHGDNLNFFGFGDSKAVTGDLLYTKMAGIYTSLKMVETPLSWRDVSYSGIVSSCTLTGTEHDAEKQLVFAAVTEKDKTKKAFSGKKVTINFESGTSTLSGDDKYTIIKEFSDILKTYQAARIRIEGNTDNTGDYNMNVKLSEKRANSVKEFLIEEFRVDTNRIIIIGNGPKHAIENSISGSNKEYRRTDFQLVE